MASDTPESTCFSATNLSPLRLPDMNPVQTPEMTRRDSLMELPAPDELPMHRDADPDAGSLVECDPSSLEHEPIHIHLTFQRAGDPFRDWPDAIITPHMDSSLSHLWRAAKTEILHRLALDAPLRKDMLATNRHLQFRLGVDVGLDAAEFAWLDRPGYGDRFPNVAHLFPCPPLAGATLAVAVDLDFRRWLSRHETLASVLRGTDRLPAAVHARAPPADLHRYVRVGDADAPLPEDAGIDTEYALVARVDPDDRVASLHKVDAWIYDGFCIGEILKPDNTAHFARKPHRYRGRYSDVTSLHELEHEIARAGTDDLVHAGANDDPTLHAGPLPWLPPITHHVFDLPSLPSPPSPPASPSSDADEAILAVRFINHSPAIAQQLHHRDEILPENGQMYVRPRDTPADLRAAIDDLFRHAQHEALPWLCERPLAAAWAARFFVLPDGACPDGPPAAAALHRFPTGRPGADDTLAEFFRPRDGGGGAGLRKMYMEAHLWPVEPVEVEVVVEEMGGVEGMGEVEEMEVEEMEVEEVVVEEMEVEEMGQVEEMGEVEEVKEVQATLAVTLADAHETDEAEKMQEMQ